jgi:hypothetical protein
MEEREAKFIGHMCSSTCILTPKVFVIGYEEKRSERVADGERSGGVGWPSSCLSIR